MCKHHSVSLAQFEYAAAERPGLPVTLYLQTFSRFISLHSWSQTIVFFKGLNRFKGVDTY